MPEIKHTFTAGRMNKDLDERLVPNGEYRDAMNIQVRTTDGDSDGLGNAGVVQNIEGNKGIAFSPIAKFDKKTTKCIGCVADEKSNSSYFLFAAPVPDYNIFQGNTSSIEAILPNDITTETTFVDSIIEVKSDGSSEAVFIDKFAIINTFSGVMGPNPTYSPAEGNNNASFGVDFGWNTLIVGNGTKYRVGMKVYLQNTMGLHIIKENTTNGVTEFGSEIIKIDGNELTLKSLQTFGGGITFEQAAANTNNFLGYTFKFIHERALEFNYNKKITGINVIDDLLMWTDNEHEPKKINITRSKEGTPFSEGAYLTTPRQTELYVKSPSLSNGELVPITDLENIPTADVKKEHITVIKKAPLKAPSVFMRNTDRSVNVNLVLDNFSFVDENSWPSIPIIGDIKLVLWPENVDGYRLGDTFTFKSNIEGDEPVVVRAKTAIGGNGNYTYYSGNTNQYLYLELTYVDPNISADNTFWSIEFEQKLPLFETKFGRFGYRYQYEDNEYSTFSPWSELVFLPQNFSYTPSKGFNDGMVNTVRELIIRDFIPDDLVRPSDVKAIDLLWKTTDNGNVYVIKSIRREIDIEWIDFTNPDNENTGYMSITSEMIHKVLPNNQLIRGWDNVPRYALAQEITGNRLIYGNYTQGYNLEDAVGLLQSMKSTNIPANTPNKSVKSLREYKFGMVFGDKYGRETPVIANGYSVAPTDIVISGDEVTQTITGDIIVTKNLAEFSNQFTLQQNWENIGATPPDWMHYVKYYVKDTSNEYYNLVMDRWYEAEDGNIWISFPSADRNKIDEETYLILKNEHGSHKPVVEKARYKVVAIENEAPDYIKTDNRLMGKVQINRRHIYGPGEGQGGDFDEAAVTDANPRELYNDRFLYVEGQRWVDFGLMNNDFKGTIKARIVGEWYGGANTGTVQARGKSPWVTVSRLKMPTTSEQVNAEITETDWGGVVLKRKFERNEVDMYLEIAQNQGVAALQPDDVRAVVDNEDNDNYIYYYIEFKDEVIENKPEFDGRFFVKIEKDDIVRRRVCHEHAGEYIPDFSFDIAYIEPLQNNLANQAASEGPLHNWEWSNDSDGAIVSGQSTFDGWSASAVEAGFAANDTTNQDITENFWNWWYSNKGTNIFLDGSKVFSQGGNVWPNASAQIGNAANQQQTALAEILGESLDTIQAGIGGPLGLAQIATNTGGLVANASDNYGVMFFSTVGENFEDELANIFKTRMQIDGTLFRFKQDPNSNVYKVQKWKENGVDAPGWNFNFPNNENNQGAALNYTGDDEDDVRFRNTIMVTFVQLNQNANPVQGRGIDISEWDPRAEIRHDGITTANAGELTIEFVSLRSDSELSDDSILSSNACWETEPKEDVGLDIYYEASNAIPTRLNSSNLQNFIGASKIRNNASKVSLKSRDLLPAVSEEVPNPSIENLNLTGDPYVYSCHGDNVVRIKRDDITSDTADVNLVADGTPISYSDSINTGGLAIDDIIEFTHTDGTITRSKITDHMGGNIDGDFTPSISIVMPNSANIGSGQIGTNEYGINVNTVTGWLYFQGNAFQSSITALISLISVGNFGIEVVGPGLQKGTFVTGLTWPQLYLNKPPVEILNNITVTLKLVTGYYQLDTEVYKYPTTLSWFNCYSFGNGVESDRIRDDFNAPQIDNGIKVSSTYLEYGKEFKGSGLIYSGLYNSTSGTNELNQFNIGEKITKDLNPSYGSIQALKTRDTNLVTFTEDKVLKVLSNKDAVFNADGNPQLTATNRVLGQAIPFAGDYGISKNPESLAIDQYRMYFSDKQRGAVLRLSGDGITPISNVGMKSYFREYLKKCDTLVGTYDVVNGEYNLSLDINSVHWDDPVTVSFNEGSKGWVSFKSFIPDAGLSVNGKYFTALSFSVWEHYHESGQRNTFYGRFKESEIEVVFNDLPGVVKSFKNVNYEGTQSRIIKHTNVNNSTEEITFTDAAGNLITDLTDGNYYNLEEKEGWYIDAFTTDLQTGKVPEFIQKENKWFNKIIGSSVANESEFSVQGLGFPLEVSTVTPEEAEIAMEAESLAISTWTGSGGSGIVPLYTNVTGGIPPYTYEWFGDVLGTPTPNSTNALSGSAGTYTVTATDSVGNQISGTFEIE